MRTCSTFTILLRTKLKRLGFSGSVSGTALVFKGTNISYFTNSSAKLDRTLKMQHFLGQVYVFLSFLKLYCRLQS
jgi:hypothetical protein